MEKSIGELRETFKNGGTKSISWRKNQLKALLQLINQNEDSIFRALDQDLGKSPVESYRDEVTCIHTYRSQKFLVGIELYSFFFCEVKG